MLSAMLHHGGVLSLKSTEHPAEGNLCRLHELVCSAADSVRLLQKDTGCPASSKGH